MSDAIDRELSRLLADAHDADVARQNEPPAWALALLRGLENTRRDIETLRQAVLGGRV